MKTKKNVNPVQKTYKQTRQNLQRAVKTAIKYGLRQISIPTIPKKITQGSINRLSKLLEEQKHINKGAAKKYNRPKKYRKITVDYYYTDTTGKRTKVGTQTITLNKYSDKKVHEVDITDYKAFLESLERQDLQEKMRELGNLMKMSKEESDILRKLGDTFEGTDITQHEGQSMLGDGSVRMLGQKDEVDKAINRLTVIVGTTKLSPEIQSKVNKVLELAQEATTYYKNDSELRALINKIKTMITDIDKDLNGKETDENTIKSKLQEAFFDDIQRRGNKLK